MTEHPTLHAAADRARARRQDATEEAPEPALLVPALSSLDLDQLRAAAPALRSQLIEALRADATERRAARGAVVTPEDTYDLVRRLTAAQEVLTQFSQAFADAAREAAALIAEEAVTAMGEQDGVPNGSLFVPDGAGQRIAVSNEWDSNSKADTWDVGSLVGWLIEDELAEVKASRRREARERAEARAAAADPTGEGVQPKPLDPAELAAELAWYESDAQQVAHEVVLRLLGLGRFSPSVKALDALRLRLAERGRDAEAAVIAQLRTRGPRLYKGVKITREPMPRSQR
jgi:hypothetical protein